MVKKNDLLIKNLNDTINGLNLIRKNGLLKKINLLSSLILKTLNKKKKIMFCGNGGSASEASHIAAEFVGRYLKERKEQSAISLTTDNSIITAIGNDYSFDEIFSKQVKAIGKTNDILITLSTSGKSKNIINALRVAKKQRIKTVLFTGKNKFRYPKLIDIEINVPADRVDRIQELHLVLLHNLCELVEKNLN